VADKLLRLAESLKAIVIADGPNTSDAETITYRKEFDNAWL